MLKKYKDKKQYRYKNYDYTQNGFYFVTICTKDKKMFFGEIENGKIKLSDVGLIAEKFWLEIPSHFLFVKLHKFVIMPDHMHGIVEIDNGRNAPRRDPTEKCNFAGIHPLVKNSLSSIINHFKGNVKRYCNKNNFGYFIWQSRFHDRIIRNEKELEGASQYIINNPSKWELEKNNPENLYM